MITHFGREMRTSTVHMGLHVSASSDLVCSRAIDAWSFLFSLSLRSSTPFDKAAIGPIEYRFVLLAIRSWQVCFCFRQYDIGSANGYKFGISEYCTCL